MSRRPWLGDIFTLVAEAEGLREDDARPLFRQMVARVRTLHDAGICHCDMGLESFVFAGETNELNLIHMHSSHQYPWDDVVGDFNRHSTPPQSRGVNAPYAAPENIAGMEGDLWSLGTCLFAMLMNALPVVNPQSTAPLSAMFDNKFSEQLVDLINGLLALEPEQRLTAREVEKHPWTVQGAQVRPPSDSVRSTRNLSYSSRREKHSRRCVECNTTDTCKWRFQGTTCNACALAQRDGRKRKR